MAALAAGAIGVAAATPSGAQDPDPPASSPSTTTATTAPSTSTTTPTGPTTPTTSAPPTTGGEAGPGQPAPPPPSTGTTATTTAPPTTVTSPTTGMPPAAPQPLATAAITLDPATDMTDGMPVTVTTTGLPASSWVEVVQCTSVVDGSTTDGIFENCDWWDAEFTDVVSDGTATLTLRVDAQLTTGFEEPEVTDCRPPGACVIAALVEPGDGNIGARQVLVAPVSMADDARLAPPPVVTATPHDQLADGQVVDVTASGLVWSRSAVILQCTSEPVDEADCDTGTVRYHETDASGSLSTQQRALAVIDTGHGPVDCRVPASCTMVVSQDQMRSPGRFGTAALTFDPTTEIVPPTLTVSPASGLVDGQVVTVTGSGFTDEFVELYLCPPDPADGCRLSGAWGFIEEGAFTAQVEVEAIVTTPAGEVDCRTSAEPCLLVASRGRPTSPRAGRAELHFATDGPLRPPPTITLDPASDLPDEGMVTVSGRHFATSSFAEVLVEVCTAGSAGWCDPQTETYVTPTTAGRFTVDVDVAATFTVGTTVVDCRAAPGCEVVATLGFNGRQARAALDFAPPSPPDDRYLEPVFTEVEVTRDVVYRSTTSASGAPVDLMLDIYEPAGDTEEQRPAVVWLHGGWFGSGSRADMAAYATAFAQRGYVAVSMAYRLHPGLDCCPTDDAEGVTDAVLASYDDARAGVRWLRAHADEYRIDRRAIAAGGVSAGATAAANLAHLPGQMGRSGASPIAAALPIAGVDTGRPDAGEPPMLAFHARGDNTAPLHLSQTACARAERLGTSCRTVAYDGVWQPATQRQRDIIRRSSDFLAEVVLDPLGYLDWTGPTTPPGGPPGGEPPSPPGGGPVDPPGSVMPLPVALTVTSGPDVATAAAVAAARGTLPRTGAEVGRLVSVALGLVIVGTALVAARRRRRTVGDHGSVGTTVAATVALAALVAGAFMASSTLLSSTDDDDGLGDESAHDGMDHDAMDHDDEDADHDGPGHEGGDASHDGAEHDDDPAHSRRHDDGTHRARHASADHSTTGDPTGHAGGHGPTGGGPTGHPHNPTGPGDPQHPHDPTPPGDPQHPHDPDPPTDPDDGFDPDWTPQQVAYAQGLIDGTEASLVRYANPGILPLIGYQWILDGKGPNEYQHWIHLSRIVDSRRLDPDVPESLVFRNDPDDGPVLEAAMYMLPPGYNLGNIPADIGWLPGWHVHENLCFENGFELVGVTVNGKCERGAVIITPPMVHVWIVDTRCGRFAGVDEHGLQCHHEH